MRLIMTYFNWHFGQAFSELYEFWENLMWSGYHFFSIPLLLKTLIRPIFRIHESAPPGTGLNIELFFQNLTVNLIARIVGFFLRMFLLVIGALYELLILLIGPIFFIIWFLLPALPILFIFIGVQMFF